MLKNVNGGNNVDSSNFRRAVTTLTSS